MSVLSIHFTVYLNSQLTRNNEKRNPPIKRNHCAALMVKRKNKKQSTSAHGLRHFPFSKFSGPTGSITTTTTFIYLPYVSNNYKLIQSTWRGDLKKPPGL